MGSSLFLVYAVPRRSETNLAPFATPLLAVAALILAGASALGLLAQTSVMAGSIAEGLKPESLNAVIPGMDLGKAGVVRTIAAGLALVVVLAFRPGHFTWIIVGLLGALATASFAWSGHGAATEGAGQFVHLSSDIAHGWAAAVWIGALVAFFLLLRPKSIASEALGALHHALHGFAGTGTVLVAILIATGVVNSWFLVGVENIEGLWTTSYGRLLSLKIVLFVAMLGLAAANRFRLTPALGKVLTESGRQTATLLALRRSVALETALAIVVLVLVAWFGTLAPPNTL